MNPGPIVRSPFGRSYRYLVALALMTAAFVISYFLQRSGSDTFAVMVGAVAIGCWYGGIAPGLVASVVGWTAAWYVLVSPRWSWEAPERAELLRWLTPVVVSVVVLWVSWALRRVGARAAEQAYTADRARSTTEALQRLTSELSSAVTPSEVAHTLVERVPALLGSMGAALGLVDGDELRIVDPAGAPHQTLTPGMRLELTVRAPITTAARTGEVAMVATRDRFEADFPDGAALAPHAAGALAVPLRAGGGVIGAMGFPFKRPDLIGDEVVALAQLAADVGGQALERSGLYDQERQSREALDRIAGLAPLFDSESPDLVSQKICHEAVSTFGSDVAEMWLADGDEAFTVLSREPYSDDIPAGTRVSGSEYPGLGEALARLEPLFIADSLSTVTGVALDRARSFGTRSSLRVPIVVGGRAERVLVLQWTRGFNQLSASILLLARRFADQAGLALEYAERRVAQSAATRNAEETRRLLDITASMAASIEPASVAEAALKEAFRGLGASAGVVVRLQGERQLEVVAALGYPEHVLAGWEQLDLDADLPLSDAVRRSELVALDSPDERARRYPDFDRRDTRHAAWLALPLVAGGSAVGGLGLSFESARSFTDGDRDFGLALSRQAGQALERATLLETEHAARMRAERMASDVAQLHALTTVLGRAGTADEVTRIVLDQVVGGIGADGAAVFVRAPDSDSLSAVASRGRLTEPDLAPLGQPSTGEWSPLHEALQTGGSLWLVEDEDWGATPAAAGWRSLTSGALGVVPLMVEQSAVGVLVVASPASQPPSDEDRKFVETVARQAAQPLERVRLLEVERASRKRAERANLQIRRLQVVTESLAGATTTAEVADVMVNEGRAVLAAEGALVHLKASESGLLTLICASNGLEAELEQLLEVGASDAGPIAQAYSSGSPVEIAAGGESSCELVGERGPFTALLCLPLLVSGQVTGVLTLGFSGQRVLDDEERRTALIMGRQCTQALERSRLHEEEQLARGRSDQLQELTTALAGALTSEEVIDVFLRKVAPALGASGVGIGLVDLELETLRPSAWRENGLTIPTRWLEPSASRTPLRSAIETATAYYADELDPFSDLYPDAIELLEAAEHRSFAFVPLVAGRLTLAVTILAWASPQPRTGADRAFLQAFASQCGQALDRAQRYESERTIAETLQRSVLPETLPSVEGATVAARYLPGTAAMDVGGDWFDTIPLADGHLGFVVGDVVGKGVQAASTMAQLRNGMRALTLDSSDAPGVVAKLNRLLDSYTDAPFATLAFLIIDPVTYETALVSAGHLPPLVLSPDGEPSFLEGVRGLPLGVDPDSTYEAHLTTLEAGSIVVLYTDGLVERRDRPLDEGLALLLEAARVAAGDPELLVDSMLESLIGDAPRADDIAVLAVALDRAPLGTFAVRLPAEREALVELRRSFGSWLDQGAISELDRRDLLLATWEAGANAIEHAQNPSSPEFRVEATLVGDKVRIEVSDTGDWREPHERPDRGLGLQLIQSLMTHLTVEPGVEGTTIVMERALSRERAGEGGAT